MSADTRIESTSRTTRRVFLSAAALPMAAGAASACGLSERSASGSDALLEAARLYGALVPEWTAEARALAGETGSKARFEAVDSRYDTARRNLVRLMRQHDCPVVVDRGSEQVYLLASASGSHEDIDGVLPDTAVVRVVPLRQVAGLG